MADLADALEKGDIETVGELAAVDINDRGIPLAVTHASQLAGARRTLWGWKRAAADFLGVKIPKEVPRLPSKPSKELPREHQRVPDGVAQRQRLPPRVVARVAPRIQLLVERAAPVQLHDEAQVGAPVHAAVHDAGAGAALRGVPGRHE